jgi:hypothetical protein
VHKILRCFSSRSCLSAVVPLRLRTIRPSGRRRIVFSANFRVVNHASKLTGSSERPALVH